MRKSIHKLNIISSVPLLALGVIAAPAQAGDEFTIDNRTEVVNFRATGAGAASSFLDPGTHVLHETEVYRAAAMANGWQSTLSAAVRYTDSNQFDPDRFSIQKFEYRLNDRSTEVVLGDYFANLSQYSMSKGVKGLGFQRNLGGDQTYIRATVGSFDGQWAYLLTSKRVDEPMDRHGAGFRYQGQSGKFIYGINLAYVADRAADVRRRAGESAWDQVLPALDWEYRSDALTVAGEHAYSNTNENTSAGLDVKTHGSANKLTVRTALGVVNLDGNLERVSTDFRTLAGGASPDRERAYLKADARAGRLWKIFGVVDYYHNDLAGQLPYQTSNTTYEVGVTKRRAFDRKTLTLSTSVRQRKTDTHGGGNDQTSDRVKFKVTDSFGALDFNGDLEQIIDKSQTTSRSKDTMYNLGVTSRIENGRWTLMPNVEFGNQERDNPAGGLDVVRTARINFIADRSDGNVLGFNYDHNYSETPVPGTDARVSRLAAYWETKPAVLKRGSLKFELARNDYRFGNAASNYTEQIARVIVTWPLDFTSTQVRK